MHCLEFILAATIHFGLSGDYNNIHPGLQCTHGDTIVGTYYNSERRMSSYIGRKIALGGGILEVGVTTGYNPKIAPILRYRMDKIFIIPAYEIKGGGGNTFGLIIGWQF